MHEGTIVFCPMPGYVYETREGDDEFPWFCSQGGFVAKELRASLQEPALQSGTRFALQVWRRGAEGHYHRLRPFAWLLARLHRWGIYTPWRDLAEACMPPHINTWDHGINFSLAPGDLCRVMVREVSPIDPGRNFAVSVRGIAA